MFKRSIREAVVISLIVIAGMIAGTWILGGFDSEETKKYKEARKKLLAQPPAFDKNPVNTEKAIVGEFTYDECYYVYLSTKDKDFIIHKGNCPNPTHHCLIDSESTRRTTVYRK